MGFTQIPSLFAWFGKRPYCQGLQQGLFWILHFEKQYYVEALETGSGQASVLSWIGRFEILSKWVSILFFIEKYVAKTYKMRYHASLRSEINSAMNILAFENIWSPVSFGLSE